jgi:hypothetical protein
MQHQTPPLVIDPSWTPTAENINALRTPLREVTPMVALLLKHKSGLQNNLMISPDAAERLGQGLIDVATEARSQQPIRTN